MGEIKRWWGIWGGGETVTFLNVRIAWIFFENCTDCTDFFKKCTDCSDFFSKIVRIVRISSKNVQIFVRIFSKKFLPSLIYIIC